MESAFVIKVNYGGSLRRFSAAVENGELDLDINDLKAKILSLFEIPSDANLTITYVDEDGDVVTLIEDEDLRDIMRQNLKFLKITVVLNNEKSGKSYAASSASSTPLRSPRVQQPFPNVSVIVPKALRSVPDPLPAVNAAVAEALRSVPDPLPAVNAAVAEALRSVPGPLPAVNATVAEALRSVPNPLHGSLLKLYTDFVSKAASSSPALSDFMNMFASMAESYATEKQPPADGETASQQGVSAGSTDLKQEASTGSKATMDDTLGDALPKLAFGDSCCEKGKEIDVGDVPAASATPVKLPVDLNANTSGKPSFSKESHKDQLLKVANVQVNKTEQLPQHSKSQGSNNTSQKAAVETQVVGLSASACNGISEKTSLNCSVPAPGMPMSSPPFGVGGLSGDCPFSGMSLPNKGGILHGVPHHTNGKTSGLLEIPGPLPPLYPFGTVFHKGVRCDGCGLHPITGPRFKSKVKEDFDLCSFCFVSTIAKAEDYIRLDRPVPYGAFGHGRPPVRGLNNQCIWQPPQTLPQVLKGRRAGKPKLDSRFVSDVTVMDGSVMAPSTPFTKIWRMRNNGGFSWYCGTQLVWIGGDKFCDTIAMELEIPAAGVPMDGELEIAIDFKSPNLPGRYISYWRMASPSGQKFGQRVWVLIQVDASLGDSVRPVLEDLNLNLPPQMPVDDFFGEAGNDRLNLVNILDFSGVPEEVQIPAASMPATDEHKRKEAEMNFPINSTLLTGENESRPAAMPSLSISYPKIETSEAPVFPVAPSSAIPVAVPIASAPSEFAMENTGPGVEAILLKELEEMGFKQVDLNKEILRMNAYDMEQSIEALCGITEWDPMLEELQEMGFSDTEKNRTLLKKNNGSIKRVVMDLLTGERA